MRPGQRWQGVGSLTRIHDSQLTCAVKWDSGRVDRSLKIETVMVKKSAITPSSDAARVSPTPPASPAVPDQQQLWPPSETPPSLSPVVEQPAAQPKEVWLCLARAACQTIRKFPGVLYRSVHLGEGKSQGAPNV